MADHTAGGAATTLVAKDEFVLTLDFSVNLLRATQARRLRCRAQVLKPGSRFSVVESEVYATGEDGKRGPRREGDVIHHGGVEISRLGVARRGVTAGKLFE